MNSVQISSGRSSRWSKKNVCSRVRLNRKALSNKTGENSEKIPWMEIAAFLSGLAFANFTDKILFAIVIGFLEPNGFIVECRLFQWNFGTTCTIFTRKSMSPIPTDGAYVREWMEISFEKSGSNSTLQWTTQLQESHQWQPLWVREPLAPVHDSWFIQFGWKRFPAFSRPNAGKCRPWLTCKWCTKCEWLVFWVIE